MGMQTKQHDSIRPRLIWFPWLFMFAIAACGTDDEAASTTTPVAATVAPPATDIALTEADFLAQGNAACDVANTAIESGIGELFAAGPTPETMGPALQLIVDETTKAADTIGALDAPASLAPQVDALLVAVHAALADATTGDPQEFFLGDDDPFAEVDRLAEAVGLASCGSSGDDDEGGAAETAVDPDAVRIDLTATEFAIEGELPTAAGRYSFVMANTGEETHMMVIARIEDDAVVDEIIASQGEVGVVEEYDSNPALPGDTAALTVDVTPGRWLIVCPITGHDAKGMWTEFTVN